jgi:glycerol kinase
MADLVSAVDQGTTSTRFTLSEHGSNEARAQAGAFPPDRDESAVHHPVGKSLDL